MTDYIKVHRSDLEKIALALDKGVTFFRRHNEMNAALHMSDPIYSPLTSTLVNARTRLNELLDGVNTDDAAL